MRRKYAALNEFYKFLVAEGYRPDNPAASVKLEEGPNRNKAEIVLTRGQVQRLLNSPHGIFELRDKAILHLLYSGPKRAEIEKLRLGDVDLNNSRLVLGGRSVFLSAAAASAVAAYIRNRPEVRSEALFVSKRSGEMKVRNVWARVKKYVEASGLDRAVDLETIRMSYAVHSIEDGAALPQLLESLGNVDSGVLLRYAKHAKVTKAARGVDAASLTGKAEATFSTLLHPRVAKASLHQFDGGHYREAVSNAMLALTELIRERTGLTTDGTALASVAFKPDNPLLVFANLNTVSGRDEQEGFHKIMLGAFQGIRNPKVHQLTHDLTPHTAAQYLVFISLLVRRVEECQKV